jgi:hypothetical protein
VGDKRSSIVLAVLVCWGGMMVAKGVSSRYSRRAMHS